MEQFQSECIAYCCSISKCHAYGAQCYIASHNCSLSLSNPVNTECISPVIYNDVMAVSPAIYNDLMIQFSDTSEVVPYANVPNVSVNSFLSPLTNDGHILSNVPVMYPNMGIENTIVSEANLVYASNWTPLFTMPGSTFASDISSYLTYGLQCPTNAFPIPGTALNLTCEPPFQSQISSPQTNVYSNLIYGLQSPINTVQNEGHVPLYSTSSFPLSYVSYPETFSVLNYSSPLNASLSLPSFPPRVNSLVSSINYEKVILIACGQENIPELPQGHRRLPVFSEITERYNSEQRDREENFDDFIQKMLHFLQD